MRGFDRSVLSAQDAEELDAAIAGVDSVLANTVVDFDAFSKAEKRFYAVNDKIASEKTEKRVKEENAKAFFESLVTKLLKLLNDFVNRIWGYRGFGFYKLVSAE